jgi:hypothetical protein
MRTAVVVLLLLAGVVPAVRAQEMTARAVIERAVAAHGGLEKLSRARHDRARMRGVIYVGKSSVPFTSEVTVELPKKYKSVVTLREGEGVTRKVTHELDGDKITITVDGKEQEVQGTHTNQLRQTLELERVMRLAPLLEGKTYAMSYLGEYKLNALTVVGVEVRGGGQRELRMYFDKRTWLLTKTEQRLDGENGKEVVQEAYYRDHRDAGGYRRPGRAAAYRDGKKVMEAELIDAVRLDEPN